MGKQKHIIIIDDSPRELFKVAQSAIIIKPSNYKIILLLVTKNTYFKKLDVKNSPLDTGEVKFDLSKKIDCIDRLIKTLGKIEGDKIIISNIRFEDILENIDDYKNSELFKFYAELTLDDNYYNLVFLHYTSHNVLFNDVQTAIENSSAKPNKIAYYQKRYDDFIIDNHSPADRLDLMINAFSSYYNKIFEIDNLNFPFCILYSVLELLPTTTLNENQKKECLNLIPEEHFNKKLELVGFLWDRGDKIYQSLKNKFHFNNANTNVNFTLEQIIPCLYRRKILILGNKALALLFEKYLEIIFGSSDCHQSFKYEEIVPEEYICKKYDIILLFFTKNIFAGMAKVKEIKTRMDKFYEKNIEPIIPICFPPIIFCPVDQNAAKETSWIHVGLKNYDQQIRVMPYSPTNYFNNLFEEIYNSLVDRIAYRLRLPKYFGDQHLRKWLKQFQVPENNFEDVGLILRIMEHFRYYTVNNIIDLFDCLLKREAPLDKFKDGRLEFFSKKDVLISNIWFSYLGRANKSGPATLPLIAKTEWLKMLLAQLEELYLHSNQHKKKEGKKNKQPKFINVDELSKELFNYFKEKNSEILSLVFVDDCIMSGGQLTDYFVDFVENYLKYALLLSKNNAPEEKDGLLENVLEKKDKLLKNAVVDIQRLKYYAIYAIGVENPFIEKLLNTGEPMVNLRMEINEFDITHRAGNVIIEIKKQFKPDDKNEYEFPLQIEVNIDTYIADYTKGIMNIFTKEEPNHIWKVLNKYYPVVQPREKEHWVQFSPFGWKANGGLTATYANCQGNTLPIIWGEGVYNGKAWVPLYIRHFNPWSLGNAKLKTVLENISAIFKDKQDISEEDKKRILAYTLLRRTDFFEKKDGYKKSIGGNEYLKVLQEIKELLKNENFILPDGVETEIAGILEKIAKWDNNFHPVEAEVIKLQFIVDMLTSDNEKIAGLINYSSVYHKK